MKKYIFKSHTDENDTKEVVGYDFKMRPSGSYEIRFSPFNKTVVNCRRYYLFKVEVLK